MCAKVVDEGDCDLFFASEVGGFLIKPFGHHVCHSEIANYLALWGFGGASQPARVSMHGAAEKHVLPIGRQVDAAITRFDVETRGSGKCHVVVGNMHIVCSANPPSVSYTHLTLPTKRIV